MFQIEGAENGGKASKRKKKETEKKFLKKENDPKQKEEGVRRTASGLYVSSGGASVTQAVEKSYEADDREETGGEDFENDGQNEESRFQRILTQLTEAELVEYNNDPEVFKKKHPEAFAHITKGSPVHERKNRARFRGRVEPGSASGGAMQDLDIAVKGATGALKEFSKGLRDEFLALKEEFKDLKFVMGLTIDQYKHLREQMGYTTNVFIELSKAIKDETKVLLDIKTKGESALAGLSGDEDPDLKSEMLKQLQDLGKSLDSIENLSMRQVFALESQNPIRLQVPTIENFLLRKVMEKEEKRAMAANENPRAVTREMTDNYKLGNKNYRLEFEKDTKTWFNSNLELLESTGLQFEEQAEHFARVSMAVTHLRLEEKTRGLGEELHKTLEMRRNFQRFTRAWALLTPDMIAQNAGIMVKDYFRDLFTLESEVQGGGKEKLICNAFNELEDLCDAMDKAREMFWEAKKDGKLVGESDDDYNARVKTIDDFIGKEHERIRDFYKHGGYVNNDLGQILLEDGLYHNRSAIVWEDVEDADGNVVKEENRPIYVDKRIDQLRKQQKFDSDDLAQLEQRRWAVTMAGKLWSVTLRAASHEVQLNGAGDFFSDRVLNYDRWLWRRPLLARTEKIWFPKKGEFAGKPFDLYMRDYLTGTLIDIKSPMISSKLSLTEAKELVCKLAERQGLQRGDYTLGFREDENGGRYVVLDKILTTKNMRLMEKNFWDEKNSSSMETAFSNDTMDNLSKSDDCRKDFWGSASFFDGPTVGKLLAMKAKWGQVGEKFRRGVWMEMGVRLLDFYKYEEKEAIEFNDDIRITPLLERYRIIEEMSATEMITNKIRDEMHKKYITTIAASRGLARLFVNIDNVYGFGARNKDVLFYNSFSALWEAIKRFLGQTFSEDMGIRG